VRASGTLEAGFCRAGLVCNPAMAAGRELLRTVALLEAASDAGRPGM